MKYSEAEELCYAGAHIYRPGTEIFYSGMKLLRRFPSGDVQLATLSAEEMDAEDWSTEAPAAEQPAEEAPSPWLAESNVLLHK